MRRRSPASELSGLERAGNAVHLLVLAFTPFTFDTFRTLRLNVIEQVFYCECVGYVTTLVWRLAGRGGGRYWVRGYRGVDAKWIPPHGNAAERGAGLE